MKKVLLGITGILLSLTVFGQQLPNPSFEDWSGAQFDGNIQPTSWNASNVEQVGFKFNFAHREAGHTGSYSMMVQDQSVGAAGITETSPGYFALGQPWVYLESVLKVNEATAGTAGGVNWTYRPDSMVVWIKRTGSDALKEDFYLLYYAWSGQARGDKYTGKNGKCTGVTKYDEESDVRQALNGNACGTTTPANQIAEGMWRERKVYSNWTRMSVPIFYMSDDVPTRMNIIFSASNYPNFRANSGLYEGNSLYVDDVSLIYSNKIQSLYIGNKLWAGFDPNSTEEQIYSLGRNATTIPSIVAKRGEGSLTNARGTTVKFNGRTLSGSEIQIVNGQIDGAPTTITVTPGDGGAARVYKIKFVREASDNTKLAGIDVNGNPLAKFSPAGYTYNVALPFGTTEAPVLTVTKQEDEQEVVINQATSVTGSATIVVTAANKTNTATYTLNFSVAQLSDNTLKDIEVCVRENASDPIEYSSVPGYSPEITNYRISVPMGTTIMPLVRPVSNYAAGAQTIVEVAPTKINGGKYTISVSTPGDPIANVYTLTFREEKSSYSLLKDLKIGGETPENFSPDQLIYYLNLPLGTSAVPAITWTEGDKYQTVTLEDGGLKGTTRVIVTAANGDQTVYKIVVDTELSDRSDLTNIFINGESLEGFSPDQLQYDVFLPVGTENDPVITWEQGDEFETVTPLFGGKNGTTYLAVTAQNGTTTRYQLNCSVLQATNASLQMITIDGVDLPGFNPDVFVYNYPLEQGRTEMPVVTWTPGDEWQTVTPRSAGLNGDYKLIVRPQSGASQTYIIKFSVAVSSNNKLDSITINGVKIDGWDADVQEYTIYLEPGVTSLPTVKPWSSDNTQRTPLALWDGYVWNCTVTAEDGTKRTYKDTFVPQASADAKLKDIKLNGVSLPGFEEETFIYNVTLTDAICPQITVERSDSSQQVSIAAPYSDGEAVILVTSGAGSSQEYKIRFNKPTDTTLQLQGINLNGVPYSAFNPAVNEYDIEYQGDKPVVTAVKAEGQSVQILNSGETTKVYVKVADKETNVYTLNFVRQKSNDSQLSDILADGVSIFEAGVLTYNKSLPAGSAYPTVTYVAKERQTVVANKTGIGAYKFIVTAEDEVTTSEYNVVYTVEKSEVASVSQIELEGRSFAYDPEQEEYTIHLDEGEVVPTMSVTPEDGQIVVTAPATMLQQQVHVLPESGNEKTYVINYERETHLDNALLQEIIIGGRSLAGFDPEVFEYTYQLPWRTTVMPTIYAVGQEDAQTIVTYFGGIDRETRITVYSPDSTVNKTYTINFPVTKSSNAWLGSLTINGIERDVRTLNYDFELPITAVQGYSILYTQAEREQQIEFISAPVDKESKIIVTAENGSQKTYTIKYHYAYSNKENIIPSIEYHYVDANGTSHNGSIVPVKGNNIIDLPYGTKAFEIDSIVKNYDNQSYVLNNGGVRRGATVIVSSDKEGDQDVVYSLTPQIPTFETAGKLKELKYNGQLVPNWRPDVYNYIVDVTSQPSAANFSYTAYNGASVTVSSPNTTTKQITFKVANGETYSVCWFYKNDGKYLKNGKYYDYLDFSQEWEATPQVAMWKATWTSDPSASGTTMSTGFKPHGWKVPADCVAGLEYNIHILSWDVVDLFWYTGKEVIAAGTNGAMLSTINGASINGSMPGMMTLGGTMSITPGKSGGSTSSISYSASNFIAMRNTPDSLSMRYKSLNGSNISEWYYELKTVVGSSTRTDKYTGNYDSKEWRYASKPITSYNGVMSKYALTINSAPTANAADYKGTDPVMTSDLQVENVHFVYNSDLTKAYIDGTGVNPNNRVFAKTVSDDYIGVPALKFDKKVHDQMQTIEWLNNGEWIGGKLTGKVTNYGENSTDKTEYTVVLSRNAVTSTNVTVTPKRNLNSDVSNDTTYYFVPFGTKIMPDLVIKRENIHQKVDVSRNGRTVRIIVTPESGESDTTYYTFKEQRSSVKTLQSISFGDDAYADFDPMIAACTLDSTVLPMNISFDKKTYGQTVHLVGDSIHVTAENGDKFSYAFILKQVATSGKLSSILMDGELLNGFDMDKYSGYNNIVRPRVMTFVRKDAQDTVTTICRQSGMEWHVNGSESHTYIVDFTQSSNTKLGVIMHNGDTLENFDPNIREYTIYVNDASVLLDVLPAELTQKLQITIASDSVVSIKVIPESAQQAASPAPAIRLGAPAASEDTYIVNIKHYNSPVSTLSNLYVGGEAIPNFRPDSFYYEWHIPAGSYKRSEPEVPILTYKATDWRASVDVQMGLLGQESVVEVQAEDKSKRNTYTVLIIADPSSNADLTGILVNDEPVDRFEAGRHYYSAVTPDADSRLAWTADDAYQTYLLDSVVNQVGKEYTLTVTAQDGLTTQQYVVDVVEVQESNNVQLANIFLDGKTFDQFEKEWNDDLAFKPVKLDYTIYLKPGTTILPEVSAQLMMAGQTVNISRSGMVVTITVTAKDGVTQGEYVLTFVVPASSNADLSMIYLGGESINNYLAAGETYMHDYYFYSVTLLPGVEIPEVSGEKMEAVQRMAEPLIEENKVTLRDTAEDGTIATYIILFTKTLSDVNTLNYIWQEDATGLNVIKDYDPLNRNYHIMLPVGTKDYPGLEWDDEWVRANLMDTVYMDTLQTSADNFERQIHVISQSGKERIYTISYEMEKDTINTLQMIVVNNENLPGFDPFKTEYDCWMPVGTTVMPQVDTVPGSPYQTIKIFEVPDSLTGKKSLPFRKEIYVTPQSGPTRVYTIHFPITLSTESDLQLIYVNGKAPQDGFEPDKYDYKEYLINDSIVPDITWFTKEPGQVVTKETRDSLDGKLVVVHVTAEDSRFVSHYNIFFRPNVDEELQGLHTFLKMIYVDGKPLEGFEPKNLSYNITLPAGTNVLPVVTWDLWHNQQMVTEERSEYTLHYDSLVSLTVAVDPELDVDDNIYKLRFQIQKSEDASLSMIYVKEQPLDGFEPEKSDYTIVHELGTTEDQLLKAEDFTWTVSYTGHFKDAEVTSVEQNGSTITITVQAEDEDYKMSYVIRQEILKNDNAKLAMIYTRNAADPNKFDSIYDFDSDIYIYDYIKQRGLNTNPEIIAVAEDTLAEVNYMYFNKTDTTVAYCLITVTAADGETELEYIVNFPNTTVVDAQKPQKNDCLVKAMGNGIIKVATIRRDVSFFLYDSHGVLHEYKVLEPADPNDAIWDYSNGNELLYDVRGNSGIEIQLIPGRIYIYGFYETEKKVISGGKLMTL